MTTANKNIQIKEITDGQAIHDLFLVREMSRGETKAGKPYLSLVLMDASGEISGRVWENAEQLMGECPAGAVVSVTAQGLKGTLLAIFLSSPPPQSFLSLMDLFLSTSRLSVLRWKRPLIRAHSPQFTLSFALRYLIIASITLVFSGRCLTHDSI